MRVLIACEYSGVVRDAFTKKGWCAVSCDLLPSETEGKHYKGDVLDILGDGWDLLIAHPPCQYLSFAGNKYWNNEGCEAKRMDAYKFFLQCYNAPIKHVCVENPRGYPMRFISPSQEIHPYFFGDNEMKRTCLWLRNLPKLVHISTNDLFDGQTHCPRPLPTYIQANGKRRYFTESSWAKKNAQKIRSKTFPAIAEAMAEQWTNFFNQRKTHL